MSKIATNAQATKSMAPTPCDNVSARRRRYVVTLRLARCVRAKDCQRETPSLALQSNFLGAMMNRAEEEADTQRRLAEVRRLAAEAARARFAAD